MLPALLEDPEEPLRTELLLAPNNRQNLALRKGKWLYIGARGSGGFGGSKPSDHAWGGPAAIAFAGSVNSDIEGGEYKADAPDAQLYDLEKDVNQTTNVIREHPEIAKEMAAALKTYVPSAEEPDKKTLLLRPGAGLRRSMTALRPWAICASPSNPALSKAGPL